MGSITDSERIASPSRSTTAGVDIVHEHSSHHARGIEVYEGTPILYGCGDYLSEHEGSRGYEEYRDDLALMYFPSLDPATGKPARFENTPLQISRNLERNYQ